MQQQESVLPGGITGEALAREVLTVEIREARDLLPADRMRSCEPYAMISIFDSSGRAIGTRKTNVVSGSLNPYWMERFEFQVTQWDKEGGYIEISLYDNCDNERLGYLRQPLFRLSETGAMEGWYFLDRPRYQSAALSVRMLLHPYRSLGAASGLAAPQDLATGISARQPPAAAGIGVSGVGSRTPLGPTVYGTTGVVDAGFASPSGIPMGASPATATPIVGAPGVTPAVGPTMARHAGTAPLFIMRHRFWGLANTYEVKDAQGLLLYRLIGNFGDKNDDIRIADASGHEVGYIREESSLIHRVYRMPSYLISVYGTSAKLKRKFLSLSEPIFSLRPFNAQSIHVKGNFAHNEFSFYQLDTIIADVSKGLAPPGDQGLYGVRVAPTFSNPLLILAAAVAIDRIHDVAGLRPISGVYSESRATLMSRVKRSKKKPVVVTTTAVPVATATTTTAPVAVTTTTAAATTARTATAPIVTPVVASAPITRPVAATTTTTVTPVAVATTVPSVAAVPVAAGAASTNPFAAYYDERGIPTTPVVSVTTMSRDEGVPTPYAPAAASAATLAREEAMMQPRAELAARETLRQEAEQQMMQAERLELGAAVPPLHQEKERDQKMTQSELRQSQPVRIPIMGAGAFD